MATDTAVLIRDVAAAWAQRPAMRTRIEREIIEPSGIPVRLGLGIKFLAMLSRDRRVPDITASVDELARRIAKRDVPA